MSESLSNEEFIEIYHSLDNVQKKLSHEEFHFVRYLLKMVLLELDNHSNRDKDGQKDDAKKNDSESVGGQSLARAY